MIYRNLIFLFLILCSCAKKPAEPGSSGRLKILYIGNSLTYTNNLPALVEELAILDGKKISSHSITLPDYSLEDHWNGGIVKTAIEKGKYDFVIAQQGPSALPESQFLLLDYAGRFAQVCKNNKSKMAMYMVWPSKARLFDLDKVIYSYTNAAQQTGSLLCPAGLAWKYVWEANPSIALYGTDDFHPGIDGSVLAALTIYGELMSKTDFNFIVRRKCSWKNDIDETKLNVLKAAALRALQ